MILTLSCLLLFNSLYIFGFKKATEFDYIHEDHPELGVIEGSKMILWKVGDFSIRTFGWFWSKPICLCSPCMASFHSSYVYFPIVIYLYGFHYKFLFLYILYVGCLAGVNWIVSEVMDCINSLGRYLDTH